MHTQKRKKTVQRIIAGALLIFMVSMGMFFNARKTQANWFDDNWAYRKAINITGHTTSENNVYLNLTGGSALDSQGASKANCGDIRFTDVNGKVLPYFIVSGCKTASTVVHVFFDTFPAGAQTIYYYYGNPSARDGFSLTDFSTAATGVTFGSYGSQEVGPGPVAYWKFDEGYGTVINSNTQSGTPMTLTVGSGAPWTTEERCISGKCLFFNATGNVAASTSISNIKTVQFWVNPKTNGGTLFDADGTASVAYIVATNGTITAPGFTSPSFYINGVYTTTPTLVANVWQHITVTTNSSLSFSSLTMGELTGPPTFTGFIDEVKLYRTVRTASEIKSDAQQWVGAEGSSAVLSSISQSGPLSTGLVGYWKMDESGWTVNCSTTSVIDSSGNGNNGAACPNSTGPAGGAIGKFGNTGSFDGSNDYVVVTDSNSLDVTSNFTFSAWIYPTSVTGDQYILSKDGVGTDTTDAYGFFVQNGGEICYETNNRGNNVCPATEDILLNRWNHVAVVFNDTLSATNKATLYVNGVQQASDGDVTQAPISLATNLLIGRRGNSGDEFTGKLDEVRMYNRSLSGSEISQLYSFAPGPVGHWKMDENTGQTLNDSSGNGLSGTVGADTSISSDDPKWVVGKFGSALSFDGIDDDARVADNDILSFGNSTSGTDKAYTFETWVYPTHNISHYFFDKSGEYEMRLGSDGRLICKQQDSSAGSYIGRNYSSGIPVNSWHHVACSYDGSGTSAGTKIYLDGIRVDNANESAGTYTAMENLGNALHFWDSTEPWLGKIDDVKIYNYVRDTSQIIEDMNAGRPAPGGPVGSAVAHWKFDETSYNTCPSSLDFCDASINGNHLSAPPSTTIHTLNGKYGKAMNATGSIWAVLTDNADLDFDATDNITMSMWIQADSADKPSSGNVQYLYAKGGIVSAGTVGYIVYTNASGNVSFGIRSTSGNWVSTPPAEPTSDDKVTSTSNVYDGNWHHVVVTKTGTSRIDIYIDGRLENSDTNLTATGTLANSVDSRIASRDDADNGDEFIGKIDELKVYRSALTGDQVKVEYNRGFQTQMGALSTDSSGNPSNSANDSYCPPGQGSACVGPIHHWNMNENTGATIYDLGSDKANGTFGAVNAVWSPGVKGSAITLNTTNDDVTIGDANVNGLTAASIDAWVKRTVTGTDVLIGEENAGARTGFLFEWYSDNYMYCQAHTGSAYANIRYNGINDLLWHHVACVYDGSQAAGDRMKIYVDGILRTPTSTSGTIPTAIVSDDTNFKIGSNLESTRGTVDDVKVYNYARSPAQVAWDYNKGAPTHWYKFNECQGTTLYNSASTADGKATGVNGSMTLSGNSAGTCESVTSTDVWYIGENGKYGSAFGLDGNDYAVVATPALPTTDFTYATWIYLDTINNDRPILKAADGAGGNEIKLEVMASDGGTPKKLRFVADGTSIYSAGTIETGAWYHVVGRRSGSTMEMFINGQKDTVTGSDSTALSFSTCGLYIGAGPTSSCGGGISTYFDGMIDDLRIYNYALTDTQIKTMMNEGSAVRFGP